MVICYKSHRRLRIYQRYWGAIMQYWPKSISTTEIRQLVQRDDPIIIEIGCNDGLDTLRFLNEFSRATIHCFEPDERAIDEFRSRIDDDRCQLHQVAVSDGNGQAQLHLSSGTPPGSHKSDWNLSSSILAPTGHLSTHPWCLFESTASVRTIRLDTWFKNNIDIQHIDFIWMDVQGAEHLVFAGASETLASTRFIYTEFSDIPMYQDQCSRSEIESILVGFSPIAVYENNNLLLKNDRLGSIERCT